MSDRRLLATLDKVIRERDQLKARCQTLEKFVGRTIEIATSDDYDAGGGWSAMAEMFQDFTLFDEFPCAEEIAEDRAKDRPVVKVL